MVLVYVLAAREGFNACKLAYRCSSREIRLNGAVIIDRQWMCSSASYRRASKLIGDDSIDQVSALVLCRRYIS